VQKQSTAGVTVTADIAYGADPRQKLDVYRGQGAKMPILVYIPGGGYVGGDKNFDGVFYGNLGTYFARHGYLTVVANYRLAPAAPWPAGAQDVGGAVAWAKANGAQYGGDPSRLIVYGQSAGATHVATYLFDPQFKADGIAAGILMSGPYKFAGKQRPNVISYLGSDESTYAARSPLTHVASSRVPLMLSVAEFDPGFLAEPTFELAAAVTRRDGRAPQVAFMAGHNHVSTVQSIGSGQDDVGEAVREFLGRF
jgi:triacylglycerol lipase